MGRTKLREIWQSPSRGAVLVRLDDGAGPFGPRGHGRQGTAASPRPRPYRLAAALPYQLRPTRTRRGMYP